MKKFSIPVIIIFLFSSCTKEKKYQYGIVPVSVSSDGSDKKNTKSTIEFISIAYADLFGAGIPQSKLINLSSAYASFGDRKVIEERIIKNLINDSAAVIPAFPSINGDTLLFIENCYKKFYNRIPGSFEKHYWKELIRTNANVNPEVIYYSMMTSDEYRFY